jgi:uncharacterized membrane protein (UPF0127 family)
MVRLLRWPRRCEIAAWIVLAMAILLATVTMVDAQSAPREGFGMGTLGIASGNETHRFTIEVARTPEQQQFGLMFRNKLAPDAGMLFVYDRPQRISMWMKNTLIPLDMIFIGADGRILNIAERCVPMSVAPIYSSDVALAVLEVNGGTAARLGLKPGDKVLSSTLGTAAAG